MISDQYKKSILLKKEENLYQLTVVGSLVYTDLLVAASSFPCFILDKRKKRRKSSETVSGPVLTAESRVELISLEVFRCFKMISSVLPTLFDLFATCASAYRLPFFKH